MFGNLDVFRTSAAMAQHAGKRQAMTAQNIANADTPGYRSMTMPRFVATEGLATAPKVTRLGHMTSALPVAQARVGPVGAESSPNGNTVSLETEMLNAVEIQREHNRALAIYKHGLDVLRLSIGRR